MTLRPINVQQETIANEVIVDAGVVNSATPSSQDISTPVVGRLVPHNPTNQEMEEAAGLGRDKQRMRSLAKGFMLNFGDEIEARLRSVFPGETYLEAKKDIETKLENYERNNPGEALTYEVLGGFVPSIVATYITKKPTGVLTPEQGSAVFANFLPKLAKTMGLGGAEAAVYSVGGGEGNLVERLLQASTLADTSIGSGISGGLYTAGKGIGGISGFAIDALRVVTRRTSTDRVNREIQRIVSESDVTPEEAVEMLVRGDVLASDPQIAQEMSGLAERSGPARSTAETSRKILVPESQAAAADTIAEGLGGGMAKNTYEFARASSVKMKEIVDDFYRKVRGVNVSASDEIIETMAEMINRFPGGGRKLNEVFRSREGTSFFKIDRKTGLLEYMQAPTALDAEYLLRTVNAEAQKLIDKGGADAQIGINLAEYADILRKSIDDELPDIIPARKSAQIAFEANDAFKLGRSLWMKPNEIVEDEFLRISAMGNDEALAALRLGYLASIKAGLGSVNKASNIKKLFDEENVIGQNFRTLFPEHLQTEALQKLGVSANISSAFAGLGGSKTGRTLQQMARQGSGSGMASVGIDIMRAGGGDVFAQAGLITKIARQFSPSITDQEAAKVVEILLSTDPLIVTKSLTDKTALRSIQIVISSITNEPLQALSQNFAKVAIPEGEQ